MAENQFQIGDVVRLKGSHGSTPDFTVFGTLQNGNLIVIWYSLQAAEFKKQELPPAALIKTDR